MIILGIDFGDKRTGVAVCDKNEVLASPYTVIEGGMEKTAEEIVKIAGNLKAEKLVLGYPKNMDNTEGFRAQKSLKLKRLIEGLSDLEVILYDERLTTVYAGNLLNSAGTRGRDKKKKIDAVSAAIILQDYIDSSK